MFNILLCFIPLMPRCFELSNIPYLLFILLSNILCGNEYCVKVMSKENPTSILLAGNMPSACLDILLTPEQLSACIAVKSIEIRIEAVITRNNTILSCINPNNSHCWTVYVPVPTSEINGQGGVKIVASLLLNYLTTFGVIKLENEVDSKFILSLPGKSNENLISEDVSLFTEFMGMHQWYNESELALCLYFIENYYNRNIKCKNNEKELSNYFIKELCKQDNICGGCNSSILSLFMDLLSFNFPLSSICQVLGVSYNINEVSTDSGCRVWLDSMETEDHGKMAKCLLNIEKGMLYIILFNIHMIASTEVEYFMSKFSKCLKEQGIASLKFRQSVPAFYISTEETFGKRTRELCFINPEDVGKNILKLKLRDNSEIKHHSSMICCERDAYSPVTYSLCTLFYDRENPFEYMRRLLGLDACFGSLHICIGKDSDFVELQAQRETYVEHVISFGGAVERIFNTFFVKRYKDIQNTELQGTILHLMVNLYVSDVEVVFYIQNVTEFKATLVTDKTSGKSKWHISGKNKDMTNSIVQSYGDKKDALPVCVNCRSFVKQRVLCGDTENDMVAPRGLKRHLVDNTDDYSN